MGLKLLGVALALYSLPANAATVVQTVGISTDGPGYAVLQPFQGVADVLESVEITISAVAFSTLQLLVSEPGSIATGELITTGAVRTSLGDVTVKGSRPVATASGGIYSGTGAGMETFRFVGVDAARFLQPATFTFDGYSGALTTFQTSAGSLVTQSSYLVRGSSGASASARVVYISAASAVPEPATWAMMLIGFGAVGSAMRRTGKVRSSPLLQKRP